MANFHYLRYIQSLLHSLYYFIFKFQIYQSVFKHFLHQNCVVACFNTYIKGKGHRKVVENTIVELLEINFDLFYSVLI